MILFASIILLLLLSLSQAVFKYYRYSSQAFYFGSMAYFGSLWGLGSIIVSHDIQFGPSFLGLAFFIAPSALSSYALLKYTEELSGLLSRVNNYLDKIILVLHLVYAFWYLNYLSTTNLKPGGVHYFIYVIYYIFVFVVVFRSYRRFRVSKLGDSTVLFNLYAFVIFSLITTVTNIILPIIGNTNLLWLGPVSGSVPLYSHLTTISSVKRLALSYSFVKHFFAEIILGVAIFSTYLLANVMNNPNNLIFEEQVVRALFFVIVISTIVAFAKIIFSEIFNRSNIDWGEDVRNNIDYMISVFESVSADKDLENAIKISLSRIGLNVKALELAENEHIGLSSRIDENYNPIDIFEGRNVVARIYVSEDVANISPNQFTILAILKRIVLIKFISIRSLSEKQLVMTEMQREFIDEKRNMVEKSDKKDEFISLASHQLRTPLSVAAISHRMLLEGFYGRLNVDQSAAINDAQESVEKMGAIIESLLESARIDQGEFILNVVEFDFVDKVRHLVKRLTRNAGLKSITLNEVFHPDAILINADEIRLLEAISVFIDNAIKYSTEGSCIDVEIASTDGFVELSVIDYGPGILKKDQGRIFDRFVRVGKSSNPEGLGLGLYLAKKTIEAHQGELIFKSRLGEGSTFGFRLPLK